METLTIFQQIMCPQQPKKDVKMKLFFKDNEGDTIITMNNKKKDKIVFFIEDLNDNEQIMQDK